MDKAIRKNYKINYKWIIKYCIYLIFFLLLSRSSVSVGIYPFAFGLLVGLTFLRQNLVCIAAFYIFGTYLNTLELLSLYYSAAQCVVLTVFVFIIHKLKKPVPLYFVAIVSVITQCVQFAFYLHDASALIDIAITMLLSVLFSYIVVHFFCAIFLRGLESRITIDEKICIGIVALALSLGLYGTKILGFDINTMASCFLILFIIRLYSNQAGLVLSILIGLAGLIYNGSMEYLAVFPTYCLLAIPFNKISKYFMPLVMVCLNLVFGYYFKIIENYSYINILEVATGGLLFLCFNQAFFDRLASQFGIVKTKDLSRDIINRNREQMSHRLGEIADVFAEMQLVFMNMVKSTMDIEQATATLVDECVDKVCTDCMEYNKCHILHRDECRESFGLLIRSSIERGKATMLDLPGFISSRCRRLNGILAEVNQLVSSYKQYITINGNMNSSRVLIGQQMGGVARIIKQLSMECKTRVVFDTKRENEVIDELIRSGIVCNQAIIYARENAPECVNVVIRKDSEDEQSICKIVGRIFKSNMIIVGKEQTDDNDWTSYFLKVAPMYDVVFGAAGCMKYQSNASGDTHSLIRLSEDKFILSLCDGMGSGENASRVSETAMNLVENFYKAGFGNDIVLESVNQLLGLGGDETFTALDICVMDLQKAMADFIKIGGVASYVKTESEVVVISGSSLPLGILEEMRPCITKQILKENDFIIMVTDGVSDAFYDESNLRQFISEQKELNPQSLADSILRKAIKYNESKPKDDMTVLVGRVVRS